VLWKRFIVGDQERILVTENGRFLTILDPGDHTLFVKPWQTVATETHNITNPVVTSPWTDFIVKARPEVANRHFTVVETNHAQVALVFIGDQLRVFVPPASRQVFWRGVAEVRFEVIDILEHPEVPQDKLAALERLSLIGKATAFLVYDGQTGVFYLNNRFVRTLEPGRYAFWTAGNPRVDNVDVRLQAAEISGQEILTKDKVSIRVNIVAEYQVTDVVKAKQSVKDFAEQLYRSLQLAVRQSLGKKTLEEILAEKTDVDEEAANATRTEMANIGVRVGAIALKDIILPGEMRDILNQVVTAEKQAQANLIRRREETAATRSLLNTAKLMEDNPILVRLKELETLEKVVEKVGTLTVTDGLEGLLEGVVSLKTARK
jgi:regulator of protease activity HflC (stomatin/prohibitin superfamily)